MPDTKKINADLDIHNISSSKKDILSFLPANALPVGIALPDRISLSGKLNGGIEKLTVDFKLGTSLGNALFKGSTQHITNSKNAEYDLVLQTQSLDLGTILRNKNTFGPVSADIVVKGKGYDTKTANAGLQAKIKSAILKNTITRV